MKQYFYLVCREYDAHIIPQKIFLQKYQAIKWGRKEFSKVLARTQDRNHLYVLYRQEITTNGILEHVRDLSPFPTKELVDLGLAEPVDTNVEEK